MGGVVDTLTGKSGRQAAQTSLEAAQLTAAGQTEALDYLKQKEALPAQYREAALSGLAGVYGLEGGTGSQQELIDRAMQSPLYQQAISNIGAGEQQIARTASATGGLRSGTGVEALATYSGEATNKALSDAYQQQLQGLTGFANMPSQAGNIAKMMAAPSATIGQGMIAGAQAQQGANQALTSGLMGLGGAAIMAPTGTFSDIRLKDNIEYLGERNGHSWFAWDWKENDLGIEGRSEGVMAHLVYETNPEAVSTDSGFILVDYKSLGFDIKEVA